MRIRGGLVAMAFLAGCSGDGGGGDLPDPPDWSGTWTGSHNDPGTVGTESVTVVISNVTCGNGICTFDGSWTTPNNAVSSFSDEYLYDDDSGIATEFSWLLDYDTGCSAGVDAAAGEWIEPVNRIEGNTSGDCSSAGFFYLDPP